MNKDDHFYYLSLNTEVPPSFGSKRELCSQHGKSVCISGDSIYVFVRRFLSKLLYSRELSLCFLVSKRWLCKASFFPVIRGIYLRTHLASAVRSWAASSTGTDSLNYRQWHFTSAQNISKLTLPILHSFGKSAQLAVRKAGSHEDTLAIPPSLGHSN